MRITATMFFLLLFLSGLSFAATINLTDGRAVTGDILKQDNKSLQISVDGVAMTYYADEIKDIDGQAFAAASKAGIAKPVVAKSAPAPAVKPQAESQPEAMAPSEALSSPDTVVPSADAPVSAADIIDQDKKTLILKFIDVFGTRQALTGNFETMLKQIEKEKPDEAKKIRQRVRIDEIIERLLPIYDRNFTTEDLKAFISFYASPEGQKLIRTIPQLMKESVGESVKYMQEKFPEVKGGKS